MGVPAPRPGVSEALLMLKQAGHTVFIVSFGQQLAWVEGALINSSLRDSVAGVYGSMLDDRMLRALRKQDAGPRACFVSHRSQPYMAWARKHGYSRVSFLQPDSGPNLDLEAEHRIDSLLELPPLLV
jgi:hypothetical protein